ncbi:glycine dehydrogenase (decarboxylating) alpha subunit /glycine dehydrogenase (decarboxylating) beta subunit [Stackebrandtia endophytica]|uniref:Glycine dehydrogenase (decarboxylating) n=1 Tax=Stackebrandtia endophytica TaxID=1496996 RepID=A0A543B4I4_9ACTN|nr:aminomethyl-transferring glycine dehydrogenase [Stackebrandtia endophytica]TQL79710.1 glycine dehydrogenase (decarboxylating) alpha subunit /glycine dehydrogenase (decarboxylating) beta subunit [Stackebrandtia endophytica]
MNAPSESVIPFVRRHIGPDAAEQRRMLDQVGYDSAHALLEAAIPESIRLTDALDLPSAVSEEAATAELRAIAGQNRVMRQMIGLGYYGTHTPAVIRRNVLENPAWYTAYTPYQPEISQGRLEALLNFQTLVSDLTGLDTAGASLLDEATAAAEAMTLTRRAGKSTSNVFVVDSDTLPQTLAVLRTRAEPLGIDLHLVDADSPDLPEDYFGVLLSNPSASGAVRDHSALIERAHSDGALVAVASDLLALLMVTSPGAMGADVAVGSAQRFGVPMGFGGPHAGFMSVRKGLERSLPGRLVGVSKDSAGRVAYRLALQTREQHIRRERATSNICTAQVLLAVMASCYAVYHGPVGLRGIAGKVHRTAVRLATGLRAGDVELVHEQFFDTIVAKVPGRAEGVVAAAAGLGVNLRKIDADHVGVSCDETTTDSDLLAVWRAFRVPSGSHSSTTSAIPSVLSRGEDYLRHPVFSAHHSETSMLRYLRRLSDADFALDRGMIPLGSCTMKLNATTQMEPISWGEFAHIHPFAPADQARGYAKMIADLAGWLAEVTGYDAVSLQPNAGSQGELAGLLAIKAYLDARGETEREVCLIPSSAHGTNAASAVMAGMRVVVVACDAEGNIDMADLDAKLTEHGPRLAAIMVTYPSTHGVYESAITQLCERVHDAGGQVYVDGANLNALLGFAKPGKFGADVSHLNLHKTFCIPHGGGGPGIGPVAVRAHLADYLPGDPREKTPVGPVSAAPFGSAGILPIPWMYLRMMGAKGLTDATAQAVLAANYVASRLADHYPVLYSGNKGLVAHECILDLRGLTKESGVTVDDVAKRLIDYGFHAPTMSFPVAGTLMVEPTESEDLGELDRFCDAMIAIRGEIDKVSSGQWPGDDNPLKAAPHTAQALAETDWPHPYTRAEAVFPAGVTAGKYWPPVGRIDGAYGDRNLACSCPPPEAFGD